MKITIQREILCSVLARVKAVCVGGGSLPILGCVLLKAEKDRLTITGNNLDQCLALTCPCVAEGAGSLAVSAARLTAAAARMDADELRMTADPKGRQLILEGGDMRCSLFALETSEFPAMPALAEEAKPVVLPSGTLAKTVHRMLPFVSDDEGRFVLCGIYFSAEDAKLQLVATDGRRLIACALDEIEAERSGIVPTAAARRLAELDTAGEVTLRMGETLLDARGPDWHLVSKLIEGNYPNWHGVVPGEKDGKRRITIDHEQLLEALPFVGVVLPVKTEAVRLECARGKLRISANAAEVGETSATIPAEGDGLTVAYSAGYLADALRSMTAERVTLSMRDEVSAARIEEPGTVTVLMPMRVG